jgi:lysophospholipase L1-like esterase
MIGAVGFTSAQTSTTKFIDAKELTLIGKMMPSPQRYHRVDTAKYHGFNASQQTLVSQSAGLALCFKTNSSKIQVQTFFKEMNNGANQTGINQFGYDLYIKKNNQWLYAASQAKNQNGGVLNLIKNMDDTEKECLLYLPNFSVVDSIKIGVDGDATMKSMPNPFRHRVIFFGSSFTHGTCANRSGMSYPMIFERNTGLYVMNLGVSGNSKLQQSFARVLADAQADVFVFDAFSNPSATEIAQNFVPFVQTLRKSHPTTPLIFMQTIYRENRNFDKKSDQVEQAKMDMGAKMVIEAMKTDKNIYFINPKNYTGDDHMTSTDGIHPSALGYYRWEKTIEPLILKIIKKYDVK